MSQKNINKALQKTLLSPLTHDLLWSQYLEAFSYELQNMQDEYSKIKNNWNINKNDKDNLIRISESFGYTPNLIINNTINTAKLEIDSIPYRIQKKTTYDGYSLIFQQNGYKGETFNYYWNGEKLIKVVDYSETIDNLLNSNHYSPFYNIKPIKNYSSTVNSTNIILDYLVNGQKDYDKYGIRRYSLDQLLGTSLWQLDTSYLQLPTKHLGIEYFPQNYYCVYQTSLGIASEDENIYETQIQLPNYYIAESMTISINNILLDTNIETIDNKEYFTDNENILNSNSYFDVSKNLVHLEFNSIPSDCEIFVTYKIDLLMTSDYFYYLEQGMEYNRRCPIIPHSGIFLSADIAQSRGSDFYFPNEEHYTVPDLKLKAITASAYNRYIVLNEPTYLDNAMNSEGQPSGKENYKLDSVIKWFLDSATSQNESIIDNFKYIACGNKPLNIINEENNQIFNQSYIIFYYNLNNDDYNPIISDISSNKINCNVVGNTVKINSIINKSLNFNGETYAYSTSTVMLSPSDDYSFGMWFKGNPNENSIGTLFDSFINISYDYNNQKLIIDSNQYACSSDEYHLLCLIFNKAIEPSILSSVDVYIDNVLMGQFDFEITSNSYPIYIGTDSLQTNNFYGEIDNLWLISKIISNNDMSYLYNNKISVISHMGNRLAYYELYDDEKYEDEKEGYSIIQSYVKSMDINNENIMLNEELNNFTSQTKFYPIIPSYFYMNYTDTLGKTITIQSNEKGGFYNKENGEIITGEINFENGTWRLSKNTIKSISQKIIDEFKPTKTPYPHLYNVINIINDTNKWYTDSEYHQEIIKGEDADNFPTDRGETPFRIISINQSEDDVSSPKINIYSYNDEDVYYIYPRTDEKIEINTYIVSSDNYETSLFSYDEGKTLYLRLGTNNTKTGLIYGYLNNGSGQLKAYYDLGESTGTTLYSCNNGDNVYIDVSCSDENEITKWIGTTSDGQTIAYKLGDNDTYYANLSFTSTVTFQDTPISEDFNLKQTVIKTIKTDISSSLSLIEKIYEYINTYVIKYIKNITNVIIGNESNIIEDSITFDYWVDENGVLTKETAEVIQGLVSGPHVEYGQFNYQTNELSVTFDVKISSDIPLSYRYYYSLDIDYTKPLVLNYKTEKSIQINEIGLEDENHELMAYMTFPNVEFHTIYDNLSAMFAIKKN